jgi:stage II sporulation protein D
MKAGTVVCLILSATSLMAATPLVSDGGGKDVSVALFSTHAVFAVTVTPVGDHAWMAHCESCSRSPLTTPLHMARSGEIFCGGNLRVTDDATGEARSAAGLWHLRASQSSHEIDVVLMLPSERYVAAVLSAEAAPAEPKQSLHALAILARTYALNGTHFTPRPGHLSADLCDSTECQAMRLGAVSPSIEEATQATAGETLQFGTHYAEVFFSQNCAGLTEDAGAVWPNLRGISYLQSHPDPYCLQRDSASWHTEVPLSALRGIAQAEGWHLPTDILAAHVIARSASHRALRIAFYDSAASPSILSASSLRFGIGRALGWNRVRSDAYDLGVRNGALVFDGRGHGHGVGLCQEGAAQMASEGKSAREILGFYFPGTIVRITVADHGWVETRTGTLTLRSTQVLPADRQALVAKAWDEARKRFPPRVSVSPQITFSPSTELFRQMTAQPGWVLASTRDQAIVLQPDAVLRDHGQSGGATLLHEMLHVLVESEAGEQAPLWLREGLVEVLAGEPAVPGGTIAVQDIEAGLKHPETLLISQRSHRAAAARVRALTGRYGMSTVRSWLSSGVPANVG